MSISKQPTSLSVRNKNNLKSIEAIVRLLMSSSIIGANRRKMNESVTC